MILRVCAYCRVSTEKDDQINSLQNQKDFFESYIKSRQDWQLVKIFADEGISGTSTRNRRSFNEMIDMCRNRKVDLIITKEVSRFARNTVDTLKYTRLLKSCGTGVLFINDNIDTRENDGEFRLSIMASVAQEESRKISERVRWGQRRSMEKGVAFGNSTYGFVLKRGMLETNEAEAEIIKLIYHKFVNEGKGTHIIARELYESGICPPKAKTWSSTMILKILRNEKYCGDLLQKKHITVDFLTHKRIANNNIEDKVFIPNHHPPIINRSMWERAQTELSKRSQTNEAKSKYSGRYWCSGRIICAKCGGHFVIRRSKQKYGEYISWACTNTIKKNNAYTKNCNIHMLNNKALTACIKYTLSLILPNTDNIIDNIISDLGNINTGINESVSVSKLKKAAEEIENKKSLLIDSYLGNLITKDEMLQMKEFYSSELKKTTEKIKNHEKSELILMHQQNQLSELKNKIKNDIWDYESVYAEVIERITVYDSHISIKPYGMPIVFHLYYKTQGYKDNYKTIITRYEIEEAVC